MKLKDYWPRCLQDLVEFQQIAKAGRSGVASGVHCHFGIQRNGSYVNPLNYLS
mgnify:CR=1 FL=1